MPLYEYTCRKCAHTFETLVTARATTAVQCPKCESPELDQLIGLPAPGAWPRASRRPTVAATARPVGHLGAAVRVDPPARYPPASSVCSRGHRRFVGFCWFHPPAHIRLF